MPCFFHEMMALVYIRYARAVASKMSTIRPRDLPRMPPDRTHSSSLLSLPYDQPFPLHYQVPLLVARRSLWPKTVQRLAGSPKTPRHVGRRHKRTPQSLASIDHVSVEGIAVHRID